MEYSLEDTGHRLEDTTQEDTMYEHILYEVDDPVARITMNRPDNLNAFTNRMLAEIRHALATAERDDGVVGILARRCSRFPSHRPPIRHTLLTLFQSKGLFLLWHL
jgi:hypothetical protein